MVSWLWHGVADAFLYFPFAFAVRLGGVLCFKEYPSVTIRRAISGDVMKTSPKAIQRRRISGNGRSSFTCASKWADFASFFGLSDSEGYCTANRMNSRLVQSPLDIWMSEVLCATVHLSEPAQDGRGVGVSCGSFLGIAEVSW